MLRVDINDINIVRLRQRRYVLFFISERRGVYSLKYKDYLILPVLIMYLLYASCAYITKTEDRLNGRKEDVPVASVDPAAITWGDQNGEYGECWYADGARGPVYFAVAGNSSKEPSICFYNNTSYDKHAAPTESSFVISDKHMRCTNNGIRYDFIFVDEMTAYDLLSGTYYQRGDYNLLMTQLTAGKFINTENPSHYYVFKENGKSVEYAGDKVFKGKWNISTSDSVALYDKTCRQVFDLELLSDDFGNINGFDANGTVYTLAA